MAKQLEAGTNFPMRPRTATFDSAAATAVDRDPSPVDWTDVGNRITMRIDQEFLDDRGIIFVGGVETFSEFIAIAAGNVRLRNGIWEVCLEGVVDNTEADIQTVEVAITNAAGTVIHVESGEIVIPGAGSMPVHISALLHFNGVAGVGDIAFRVAQSSASDADGELSFLANRTGYVRKVGNMNETGNPDG